MYLLLDILPYFRYRSYTTRDFQMSKTCFLFVVLLAIISQCLTVARKATLPPEYDTSNPRLMGSVSILSRKSFTLLVPLLLPHLSILAMGIGTIVWSVSAFLGLCCFLSMSAFMDTKRAKAEEQNEAKAQSMSELRDRLNVLRAKELELEQARVKYAQMFHTYEVSPID